MRPPSVDPAGQSEVEGFSGTAAVVLLSCLPALGFFPEGRTACPFDQGRGKAADDAAVNELTSSAKGTHRWRGEADY